MRLSGATDTVQLFEPDRDTVLFTLELQQFHHHELSNIAAHAQSCAITGLTSYFSFSQMPEPLSARHASVLALLVPHMHAALNRIVGAEQEQIAAAPDSVASNLTPREREVLD